MKQEDTLKTASPEQRAGILRTVLFLVALVLGIYFGFILYYYLA